MSNFKDYAHYYNLLYKDKDYEREVAYIKGLIGHYAPTAQSILEVGCGTGIHANMLHESGFSIIGIDRSPEMIKQARQCNKDIEYNCEDLQSFTLDKPVDIALALFHVISYQISNDNLVRALENISRNLHDGGLFIFDCWYGPAVLGIKPEVRIKRCAGDGIELTRIAEPEVHTDKNTVDVKYHIFINDKGRYSEIKELHEMRYLFEPEVNMLLAQHGMQVVHKEEWLTGNPASDSTWGVVFIVKKEAGRDSTERMYVQV